MTPSNNTTTTTVTGGARLAVLPRSFKDMLLSTEAEKDNREVPEIMQAPSQAVGNPRAHFTIMTGERYLTCLVKIQGWQDPILINYAISELGNLQKWIGTWGHKIIRVPRTRRFGQVIQGRPNQDACAWKQERKNAVHRTIEGKHSSGDWSHPDPISNPRKKNTNIYFTRYAPVPPFILKKIVEYNSSTYKEIAVSCVKVLRNLAPLAVSVGVKNVVTN